MATKTIISAFTENSIPKTGLSPLIDILDADTNIKIVTAAAMTELQDGYYKYDFTSYDFDKKYAISVDGGATLQDAERYHFGGNDSFKEDNTTELLELSGRILGLVQENFRLKDQVYDGNGQLTSAKIRLYPSKADTIADTNHTDEYSVISNYDIAGKRTDYYVVKEP
jgi:hypothetical protein